MNMRDLASVAHAERIFNGGETGSLSSEPSRCAKRAAREQVARCCAVGDLDVLIGACEADGVFTDHIAAADGQELVIANGCAAFSGSGCKADGGSGWRILLGGVMRFDDGNVRVGAEDGRDS